MWTLPDQESNLCSRHWQADSVPPGKFLPLLLKKFSQWAQGCDPFTFVAERSFAAPRVSVWRAGPGLVGAGPEPPAMLGSSGPHVSCQPCWGSSGSPREPPAMLGSSGSPCEGCLLTFSPRFASAARPHRPQSCAAGHPPGARSHHPGAGQWCLRLPLGDG